jgi:hypothetical protein
VTIDIPALRALLAAAIADPPGAGMVPALPWHVENDLHGFKAICSSEQHNDGSNVNIATDLRAADAALICAAVNALPELLAIAEQHERLLQAGARFRRSSTPNYDGVYPQSIRDLLAAVDAARKEPSK